jgi:hypothetical protein
VKASYFPNWTAAGADGPYRVAPNLMVVVPTDTEVQLRYARTPVDLLAVVLSLLGIAAVVGLARRPDLPVRLLRDAPGTVAGDDPPEPDPDADPDPEVLPEVQLEDAGVGETSA